MNKQGLDMRHTPETGTEERKTGAKERENGRKRFDLSVPQVAGSALAAVLAAKLASTLGVYGTILGAGVISVIATCGGPVLQHVFKRTGEQMREAAGTQPKPRARQLPAMPRDAHGEEFTAPTTHGTRVRGWKRPALGAAVVFLVAMGGITAYELSSGQDLGGTQGSTTFGSAVRGGAGGDGRGERRPSDGGTPGVTPSTGTGTGTDGSGDGRGTTPTPGTTPGTGTATPDDTPTPTPSGSTGPTDGATTAPPATPPATPASPPVTDPASPRGSAAE
ncbi:hypothetical protein [Streptomyces sp. NPDC051921]|uniref:hypothetical protein n=1 Tax=Streptomyces sp. NPDC051921 TaxID=3155806 RepID=UPI00343E7573